MLMKKSGIDPLYIQIADQIREQILSGKLKAGDAVKSIRLLSLENNVSVITTKKAYQVLVDEKLLIASIGKGYFVSEFAKEMSIEYHLKNIENHLSDVICSAIAINLEINEIYAVLETLWKYEMCHGDTNINMEESKCQR